jgi:hypothetical protein
MQSGVKPKATENSHDFVVVPDDQVRVAPSDAEITNLLRAAARHQSEGGTRTASDSAAPSAAVPVVDATFRATDVNEGVRAKGSFFRRAMRALAALLLALGIGAAAMSWQTVSFAAKKALVSWAPKWAIAASLPLDMLGLGAHSTPSEDPAEATPTQTAAPAQSASDSNPSGNTAAVATASSDAAQQLQSMSRDLANANLEVEALRASIAELKASQQQMARDLAKVSDKFAEQNAKPKLAVAAPRPPVHRPAPAYSSTNYAPVATPAPPPAYRPTMPPYSAQASAAPPSPAAAQPYAPPPTQIQPQADPGVVGSAPRPPMPLSH